MRSAPLMPTTGTRTGLLLVLLALVAPTARAQIVPEYEVHPDYTVRQWTVLDGLPVNTVRVLARTS